MDANVAISASSISKKYCKSLKRSMFYGVMDIGRNSLGMSSHSDELRKGEFWAVNDISFSLEKGQTLGIIGPNGSGKTTMLKMLNGIFWPDRGKISIRGNVGALIAVGAGFHPMLTGRENIYLNGAILGLNRKEINEKFDEIVAFANVGDFLDSPIKFYSSGMFVRLGFSIAVHIEPDVLLIDEILAVGDLSFQNKSLRKLAELREKANSVVFVSHNLEHVRNLCDRTMILDAGKMVFYGDTDEAISQYHQLVRIRKKEDIKQGGPVHSAVRQSTGDILITNSGVMNSNGDTAEHIKAGETFTAFFDIEVKHDVEELYFTVGIRNENNYSCIIDVSNYENKYVFEHISRGIHRLKIDFSNPRLVPGVYFPVLAIRNGVTNETYERVFDLISFIIEGDVIPRGVHYCTTSWHLAPRGNPANQPVEQDEETR